MQNQSMWRLVTLLLFLVVLVAACDAPSGTAPSAESLLPLPVGYTVVMGQTLQDFITGLGSAAGALSAQPGMIAAIIFVDSVSDCYQQAGAVAYRLYSKSDMPVVAGAVAIINRDLLTDPNLFLRCTGLAPQAAGAEEGQGGGGIQPCTHTYATEIEDDTFDILYAGTDLEICQEFCRALPNCTGHP